MTTHQRPAAGLAAGSNTPLPPPGSGRPLRASEPGKNRRDVPLTRRYDVSVRTPHGEIDSFTRVAPATAMFEDAFAAFARGTLIATAQGPVAVEDLAPGMTIQTVSAGPQPLLWVGSMTVYPERRDGGPGGERGGEGGSLTRLAADAFGYGRPAPDLVLGPRARLLYRSAGCRDLVGADEVVAPAHAFIDGVGAIQLRPMTPVRVYHLALHGQHILRANGMEVESYHPGPSPELMMTPDTLELFLSLFPHVEGPQAFGPMSVPRLTAFELDRVRAA